MSDLEKSVETTMTMQARVSGARGSAHAVQEVAEKQEQEQERLDNERKMVLAATAKHCQDEADKARALRAHHEDLKHASAKQVADFRYDPECYETDYAGHTCATELWPSSKNRPWC